MRWPASVNASIKDCLQFLCGISHWKGSLHDWFSNVFSVKRSLRGNLFSWKRFFIIQQDNGQREAGANIRFLRPLSDVQLALFQSTQERLTQRLTLCSVSTHLNRCAIHCHLPTTQSSISFTAMSNTFHLVESDHSALSKLYS